MSKNLSIDLSDELYAECVEFAKKSELSIEAYITQSISLYNKINKRKEMIKGLTQRPADHSSSAIIRELSKLQDSRIIL